MKYEVNQCIQDTRYQVVFQRQPSFLFGKVKNNTIFNYNTVQSQLFIATEGRTMFAPFIH